MSDNPLVVSDKGETALGRRDKPPYASYAFYCVVLATGVGLSQIRANNGIRPSPTVAGKLYSFVFVWSFVVCMHLFSDGSRQHSLSERLSFLASLFGVI